MKSSYEINTTNWLRKVNAKVTITLKAEGVMLPDWPGMRNVYRVRIDRNHKT